MTDAHETTSLDPKLEEAIRTAVAEAHQPNELAKLLCAGFDEVVRDNETLDDLNDFASRLLADLLRAVEVSSMPPDVFGEGEDDVE